MIVQPPYFYGGFFIDLDKVIIYNKANLGGLIMGFRKKLYYVALTEFLLNWKENENSLTDYKRIFNMIIRIASELKEELD